MLTQAINEAKKNQEDKKTIEEADKLLEYIQRWIKGNGRKVPLELTKILNGTHEGNFIVSRKYI